MIGATDMACAPHKFSSGQDVIAAIRPEDVIPHGDDAHPNDAEEAVADKENVLDVMVHEMEFLGSFWRCRLANERFGGAELIADFSINAVRRLDLAEQKALTIELPVERLMVFASEAE
jgi:iron(III) transport system ATP-binding protein